MKRHLVLYVLVFLALIARGEWVPIFIPSIELRSRG